MTDKICKNCPWWQTSYINDEWTGAGECLNMNIKCGDRDKVRFGNMAYVDAGEEEVFFITGPNFGCIHWESKDEEEAS